tara:strand:+ start:10104 stop:12248 length:2145 start_codon:yes stop_codon:yes gene_type:complete
MSRLCWDVETDGLLESVTKLHCIATVDVDTSEEALYADSYAMMTKGTLADGLQALLNADLLIGHNLIKYDHPVIEKLTGICLPKEKIFDTLTAVRLIWANVAQLDHRATYKLKGGMMGSHSLGAWGIRLGGSQKMDYSPVMDSGQPVYEPLNDPALAKSSDDRSRRLTRCKKDPRWEGSIFTPMMGDYCLQDVRVNTELFLRIERQIANNNYYQTIKLEHDASWLLAQQERNGFKFDEQGANRLLAVLSGRREALYAALVDTFGGWFKRGEMVTPSRTLTYRDPTKPSRVAGAPFTPVEWVEFNPSSRTHIIRVLKERGWKPTEFTPSGEPKVDEAVLAKLKFPEAPLMAEWFLIQKRLGQLYDGQQAWLSKVTPQGYIHHSVTPNGAVTGRATHHNPNLGQVPSTAAPYGGECRDLFTVPDGWVLFGSDAAGLELRCLAHFMSPYDNGAYIDTVLNGDVHWANAQAAGFVPVGTIRDEHDDHHEHGRRSAKRFIYSYLYGCGAELTGEQVGYTDEEYQAWKKAEAHIKWLKKQQQKLNNIARMKSKQAGRYIEPETAVLPTRERLCHILKGTEVQENFTKGLPALRALIEECKALHKEQGYILGLDGRKIYTRSAHAALNSLLQGAGAVICKQWIVELERLAIEAGYTHGLHGDFMYCAWVHDEVQIACRTRQIAEHFGELSQTAMRNVQKLFNFRCQLDTDFKIGATWKDTH